MQTIIINITGHVQGVFFRKHTRAKAVELGVAGTVRNLDNGNVEVIATGTKAQLDSLINWCREGSPKANVTKLEWDEISPQSFQDFSIV